MVADTASTATDAVDTEAADAVDVADTADAVDVADTADTADTAEIADTVDDPASSFTVTLDANGGYFVNEWDDVLGEYVDRTEILNKVIPVGEAVSIVPMRDPEDILTFVGWSLERDGEVVVQGEYAPLDSCTLFAVWETVDETVDNIEDEIQEDDSEEAPVADEIEDDWEQGRTDETDIPATTEDNQEVADEVADKNVESEEKGVKSEDNPADNTDQQLQEAVEETVTDEAASIVEEEADEEKISTEPMFTGESISGNHMWYRYNGNIDIRGYDGSNPIQTTYNDNGYETVLLCDGDKETLQFSQNGEAASHESGLTVTPNISFSSDGYYTIVKYTVKNTSITSKSFSLGVCADVDIDSDDCASVYKTNNGLRMVSSSGGRTYYLVCRNISGAISAGTLWFGPYGNRFDNAYNDTDDTELTGIDSGLAFSWKNQVISAGGSATYVYQIGIGETGVIEDYNEDFFVIGRDSNSFMHGDIGAAEIGTGRIGSAYPTSLYYYCKLTEGLKFTEEIELLDIMNKEKNDGSADWGGSCEGLSISLGMANLKLIDISRFKSRSGSTPTDYNSLISPRSDLDLRDLINYYHLLQHVGKNNNPCKKICNLGYGIPIIDGKWTLYSGKQSFWQDFINDVKEANAKKTPLLFSMGYTNTQKKRKGHTILTCGYKETDQYHIVQFYDCNNRYSYLYLFIDKSNYQFSFSYSGDNLNPNNSYANEDNWNNFEYFGINNWNSIDRDIEISEETVSTSRKNANATSVESYAFFTVSGGESFRLENSLGQYLEYGDNELSGNMNIYDFEILGDSLQTRFKIDNDENYRITNFNDSTKFCFRTDNNYLSVLTEGADGIIVNNGNSLVVEGKTISYNVRMGMNTEDGLIGLSGQSSNSLDIEHNEGNIIVKSDNQSDISIKKYDTEGHISSKKVVGKDTVIIDEKDKDITKATITGISTKTYTGKAVTQTPTVTLGSTTLTPNTDYTVSYSNNVNVGTATVMITGIGNYTGTTSATFKINKAAQSITAKATASSIAVGKTATVSITGNKGKKSYKSSNTAVATVNASTGKVTAKKVGTVKITATSAATSNYNAASKTVTIKIVPVATSKITAANQAKGIKVAWKKVTGANGYIIYRNNQKAKTITSGSTVTWTDTAANTNGTKYVYKIVAKASTGNSTLNKSLTTYKVARPTVKTLKNSASKKMTVKWAKNGKATGYQIQYSTSKKFSSGNKTTTVTKVGTVSKTIGSLAAGKTYYVRIRTYKTVGKTKCWSAWSATKNVKIKPLAIVKQGTCGKGVKWKLDSYGKLTFSGSGSIPGYYLNAPWQAKAKSINSIVIGNGIIGIGENTFYDCDTLTSVTIPASVTKIGKDAFAWCNKLTKVKISKSLTNKYAEAFIHTPWFNSIVDKKLAIRIYSRELKGKKGEFCLLYITNDNIPDLIYKSVPYDYTLYINGAYMESVCVGGPGTKLYFAYYPYKNFYKICDDKKYPSYYTVASENGLIGCYECLSAVSYGYYEGYISDYDGGRSFNYNLNKWIADREITKKEFNAIKTKRADGESEKGCKFLNISKSNLAKNGLDAYK